ncbi:MAG: tyrosine-type recombinase/integrase, partial [Gammaproteobacteria bacterium]|nr:tyrosine-type recombinase/integrase [Gammaproteobacteria bacterium]
MKFTDRNIQALKPRPHRYEVWEDNGKGFGLRISPAGRKSFTYLYRHNKKGRRMTLGTFPEMSLAEAHERHAQTRRLHKQGIDPGDKLQEEKRQEMEAETVAELARVYLERHAKVNKRTWLQDERMIKHDILPRWGKLKAKDIRRRQIVQLLDSIADRGAPAMANRTHALLSKMFKVGVQRGVLDASPFVHIAKPGKEKIRDRNLDEDEIRAFWCELDKTKILYPVRLTLKLLLLTAQRRGEVAKARKLDIDLEKQLWTIPEDNAKNQTVHVVPLNDMAFEIVQTLLALSSEDCPWLVPSPRMGTHIDAATITNLLRRHFDFKDREAFVPHDLRRTAATMMIAEGVDARWVDKVLNHKETGVIKHYDKYDYLKEKRQALAVWERKLKSIVWEEKLSKIVVLNSVR